ncbi:MAG: hypothetical protein B6D63_06575 [Candidatus Latescibacteria bacterium 4484_7]|nr:MAG: hypothetical protein B6D63_06575 [Candidatus Latescibacteria bacterium 4484_7]RKZ05489.1 MAG: NUDIX hydrolase [bacterium]
MSMIKVKKFCPYCGAPLVKKESEGRMRYYCNNEQRFIYENPLPAATSLVTDGDGRILLVYRDIQPGRFKWALPGGFIEVGESPVEAAKRELFEETAIEASHPTLIDVLHENSKFYHTSILIIGYHFSKFTGTPKAGDDAKDAAFFPLKKLPELAFDGHEELIKKYLKMSKK